MTLVRFIKSHFFKRIHVHAKNPPSLSLSLSLSLSISLLLCVCVCVCQNIHINIYWKCVNILTVYMSFYLRKCREFFYPSVCVFICFLKSFMLFFKHLRMHATIIVQTMHKHSFFWNTILSLLNLSKKIFNL